MIDLYKVARPLLFLFKDPETSHGMVKPVFAHRFPMSLLRKYFDYAADRLAVSIDGVKLNGPIGNAAGLDKDCEMIPGLGEIFDYVVVGSIPPYEWHGWSRPRIARNVETRSLVNKMGFPSKGPAYALPRLSSYRGTIPISASVTVRPLESENQSPALEQLYKLVVQLSQIPQVKMLEVNFSSPNTPGLQGFFEQRTFEKLALQLHTIVGSRMITFLKLPPYKSSDVNLRDRNSTLAETWLKYGGRGITLTNALPIPDNRMPPDNSGNRTGGLSGGELYPVSILNFREFYATFGRKNPRPIINYVGGAYPENIPEILETGRPHTIQMLTPFIYEGPQVVRKIKEEIVRFLDSHHYNTYQEFLDAA